MGVTVIVWFVVFFFKQKTAYEVRISDWSSDVCSSDLSIEEARMLRSPILKYVAGPQSFAYMPPILAGCSVGTGMFLWFFGQIAGFGVIPGILIGLCACVASVVIGFKEPHIPYLLLARQQFIDRKSVV